jgi:signal transduction histidine kinase
MVNWLKSRSITVKLMGLLLLSSLIGIVLVAGMVWWFVEREFDTFILANHRQNFIADVSVHYINCGTWEGVDDAIKARANQGPNRQEVYDCTAGPNEQNQNNPPPPENVGPPPPTPIGARENNPQSPQDGHGGNNPPKPPNDEGDAPARFILVDSDGIILIPFDHYRIGDKIPDDLLEDGEAVVIGGATVGYAITTENSLQREPDEQEYVARNNRVMLLAGIIAAFLALAAGGILARVYTRPLRELTAAAENVGKGDLDQRVTVRSQDELGVLATQFNRMSEGLAIARQLRQQMTADIAHDLRTPITVIAGYLEAMRDGDLSPNNERFEAMYQEAQLLERLVEDLRTLSLADAGELPLTRGAISTNDLLEAIRRSFEQKAAQQAVVLTIEDAHIETISVDFDRMSQVLGNLVSNALRYVTSGGRIALSARRLSDRVVLEVVDNGEGIESQHLPHIFERFYRADRSRPDGSGESGLGLAIAKSIVEAHGGQIGVESHVGQGTTFRIALPL